MKNLLIVAVLVATQFAHAGSLIVTCGKNAYESLEAKNPGQAEFVLELKTKGPNNPPEVVQLSDDFSDIKGGLSRITMQLPSITVEMRGFDKYEISNIQNCSSIETGSADISFSKYIGGFAGYGAPVRGKCSCLDKAL